LPYDVYFDKQQTGRTHQVNNGGVIQNQPILGPDGEPESEYVLGAIVDGHAVPLQTFTVGYVEHMVGRDDTEIDSSASESSASEQPAQPAAEQPASPPAGEGTAGEGAQPQPAPADQPSG
jgi:hypothetical protein